MNQKRFADNLNDLLIRLDITQSEFSRKIGCNGSNTVSIWLSGDGLPSLKYLWKICTIFHVSYDEMMKGV